MNTRDKLLPVLIDATTPNLKRNIQYAALSVTPDERGGEQIAVKLYLRDEAAFIELIKALREMPK